MYIIKKLPILLPFIVSIFISLLGIHYGYDLKELSYKLTIGIVIFYFFGVFIRYLCVNFLISLLEQNEKKIKLIKEYELERERNKKKNSTTVDKENTSSSAKSNNDYDDEFKPFMPEKL